MKRLIVALLTLIAMPSFALTPDSLHRTAHAYYEWSAVHYPVNSSDQGLHTWDDRLTDYTPAAIASRQAHVHSVLDRMHAVDVSSWSKEDKIDWILFRAQLDRDDFANRVLRSEETDPQTYVNEASNAIFSLLKKEYDAPRKRALAATARLRKMPAMVAQGQKNLTAPVRLYAQLAIDSARSIDSLFDSVDAIARDLTPPERADLLHPRAAPTHPQHHYPDCLHKQLPS